MIEHLFPQHTMLVTTEDEWGTLILYMYMYEITRILFGTVVFCLSEELHALLLLISVSTAAILLSSSLRLALTSSTSLLVFCTSLRICFSISEEDVCSLEGEAALLDVIPELRAWVGIRAGTEDCAGKPLQKDNRLTADELVCSSLGVTGMKSGLLSKLSGEELPMESKSFINSSIFRPTLSKLPAQFNAL